MDQSNATYYFRKRDYAKIRNWYQMAKDLFVPEDTLPIKKSQKSQQWHYKFEFGSIDLNEQYGNSILKSVASVKQVIIHSSILERSSGCVVSMGKQVIRECTFNPTNYMLMFSQEVVLYFYIDEITPRDYYFCLHLQIVTKEGNFLKLASSNYSLHQNKQNKKGQFILYSHRLDRFDLEEKQAKVKAGKKEEEGQAFLVGVIEMEQQLDQIKEMSRYLPQLRVIDQQSKLPPSSNFNLKKKKQQMIIDAPYKISLESLLIKVSNPSQMQSQILANNPFTMSHKELVEFQIKNYAITIDMHNGWKFINQHKNTIIMELVVENQQEIYLSSKQTQKLNLSYFDHDFTLFVIILTCQVEFKIKESVADKRTVQFVMGWLPLPLDLSLKQSKMELLFVNDHPFPTSTLPHLNLNSFFTATLLHPLYQKYKLKGEDKKVLMNQLPIPFTSSSEPHRNVKVQKRMKTTETYTSNEIAEREALIDQQIQALKAIIQQGERQIEDQRLVVVSGKAENGEAKKNHESQLIMQDLVGKILRVKIQVKSLIAQSQIPSCYYLPRKLQAHLYFLRQNYSMKFHISDERAKYHIPVSLNSDHPSLNFAIHIHSVQQYETIINSRLVLAIYEQGCEIMYGKGLIPLIQMLGEQRRENICYMRVSRWRRAADKLFGSILINCYYQLQRLKENHKKIQEFSIEKEMHKLSMEERLKMRIGNFKNDESSKIKAVSILKQKKHAEYVADIVDNEFMSEGEIVYELGVDSLYLLAFRNEDKSENNVFTFHLNCPYAELVTDEKDFRQMSSALNVQSQNYKRLKFIVGKDSSYYQTSLHFNQSVGLLIRLNLNEHRQGFNLKKIEVTVRRNTLETRKFILKCTYKEPIIWDVQQSHELLHHHQQQELRVSISEEVNARYKQISILSEGVKYDYKTKQLIFAKCSKATYELLCLATPAHSRISKVIIYKVQFLPGKKIHMQAGQKVACSIEFQKKYPIQIVRTYSRAAKPSSAVRFAQFAESFDELSLQPLQPSHSSPITISTYDISGQKLWTYLLKVTAVLSTNCQRIQVDAHQMQSFSLNCSNPYACSCSFNLATQSKALKIESTIEMEAYGERLVLGRLLGWASLESSIFLFMNDMRGNVIQSWEIMALKSEEEHQG